MYVDLLLCLLYFSLTTCSACRPPMKIGIALVRDRYGDVRAQGKITIMILLSVVE